MKIIKFVERNVDGCGSNAEVIVSIKSDWRVSNDDAKRLADEIKLIKKEWANEPWDTDSIVEEALLRVFGQYALDFEIEFITPDIEVEF